ncbi:MAG: hypothetical protein DWQ18_09350 [Crenarchaeota archaeon]|nr:MAG: hypothetical protein DWQ17_00435 [Thermoproteota archaeon]RDJ33333.1 MAG: hypothetical protein DWQ18_09350 [Thermoproteota archaeon]RDJ36164.1 MAG: hypothetical protein DWQ19_05970 [Thermoproteota archaeon]RDJ38795.1 MAG: hypothetical protein DWQ13_00435 [Thermoproteota archaeon]
MNLKKLLNSKAFQNISSIGFANIVGNTISALFWIYLAQLMSSESYGELGYLIAIVGIASNMSLLGGSYAITVYTSKGVNIQPPIFLISLFSSIMGAVVIYFMFNNIGMSFYVIGFAVYSLVFAELIGMKMYKKWSKYFLLQKTSFVVLSIILFYSIGIDGVIIGYAISYIIFLPRILKTFKISKFEFRILKERAGFLINSYLLDLSVAGRIQIDKIIIGPFFGFALLGNYYLGLQVVAIFTTVPTIIFTYTLPADSTGESTKKIKILAVIASFGLALLGVFVAPVIIPIVFPEYQELVDLIPILSLSIIPRTIATMYTSRFLGKEKSKHVAIGQSIGIVLLISGIFVLGQILEVTGLAIAFVLSASGHAVYLMLINYRQKRNEVNSVTGEKT